MKLKYHFETVAIGGNLQMIPVGSKDFNGVLIVNETMKDIMDLLEEERTEGDVVSAMMEQYADVSLEEMTTTVRTVCSDLWKDGFLTN